MKKVCKCLCDAIFASLQTLERECRSPGGVAFALPSVTHTLRFPVLRTAAEIGCFRYPGVSLSLYPRLLPRLSFGELKVPTPCFHELCTRLGVVAEPTTIYREPSPDVRNSKMSMYDKSMAYRSVSTHQWQSSSFSLIF